MGMYQEWGEKRNVYRLLVGKPEGKRPRGRLDNIKMDLAERWCGVDWIGPAQGRDTWRALVSGSESLDSIKCQESIKWLYKWWPFE
jgi:hypothetical protein